VHDLQRLPGYLVANEPRGKRGSRVDIRAPHKGWPFGHRPIGQVRFA
jgi:hypothetical protein